MGRRSVKHCDFTIGIFLHFIDLYLGDVWKTGHTNLGVSTSAEVSIQLYRQILVNDVNIDSGFFLIHSQYGAHQPLLTSWEFCLGKQLGYPNIMELTMISFPGGLGSSSPRLLLSTPANGWVSSASASFHGIFHPENKWKTSGNFKINHKKTYGTYDDKP